MSIPASPAQTPPPAAPRRSRSGSTGSPLGLQHPPRRCINPGFSVRRVGERLLVGAGRTGLELEGIDEADHLYVLALAGRTSRAAAPLGTDPGYPPRERCLELDALLAPALVPIPTGPERAGSRLGLAPDVAQWSVAYDRHAGTGLQRRAEAVVVLEGAPRAAQYAADLLLAAGVGTLVVRDPAPVAPQDILAGLLGPHRIGRPRGSELLRSLASRHPGARLCAEVPDGDPETTTTVLLTSGRDGRCADGAADADGPGAHWLVLPLEHADAAATVGPLHIPGLTPCRDCGDAASARLRAERSALPGFPRPAELELTLASTIGSLAAMHVLMAVDAVNVPATAARIIGVDLATGGLRYDDVAPRPGCLCVPAV